MQPIEVKKDIWWVGVIDWNLRDFHGYETEKGSTYNAYLVKGEKNILFDTVKADFKDRFISNLTRLIEPEKIDYIVSNHAEMDHSGSLPEVIELVRPEKLLVSRKARDILTAHFDREDWPFEIVDQNSPLDIGGRTLRFIGSPMLHWPESMVSYLEEDRILISNDIFGQHWATSERFDDQVNRGELDWQAAKYYANIFLPVSTPMGKFLAKIREMNIRPEMLAVDHGLIWRKDIDGIMDMYDFWSSQKSVPKAVIVFDTMWGSTRKMAEAIEQGLAGDGVRVKLMDLRVNHRSDIITEILDARAVILGSSVLNKNILPKMGDFTTYLTGLSPANKLGAAFGSYGWKDVATPKLMNVMEELGFKMAADPVSAQYVPDRDALDRCFAMGVKLREAIMSEN